MLAESFLMKPLIGEVIRVWQLIPILLLIILVVFWKIYRSKQM